jgi:hypothetical protein
MQIAKLVLKNYQFFQLLIANFVPRSAGIILQ